MKPWTLFLLALHPTGGWAMHHIEFETEELARKFAGQWPTDTGWRAIIGRTMKETPADGGQTA